MKLRNKRGFTLIELLVVISIILIASSIIFIGGGGGDGVKLSSSQRIISGIAQGARGQAILKNSKTRLIIYTDAASNTDDDKKLRFFGIIYGDPETLDASGNPTQWVAATQGTYLPEGIYYNRSLGDSVPAGNTMNIDYPLQAPQPEGGGENYYYYEFNSNGTMATGFDNAWLALQAGNLMPETSGSLAVNFDEDENESLKAALIFRRAGTTTQVNDPTRVN